MVATLLVTAGIAVGAPAAYADNEARLGVSPGHGGPDAEFTVTARWQADGHGRNRQCRPDQITFQWDNSTLGSAAAVPAGDACVATLRATPPAGTYQGVSTHFISASGVRGARVAYRVVAGAVATPANPEPSSGPTAEPTPESTETATAEAQADSPTAAAAVPGNSTAPAAARNADSGLTGLIIGLGALLFLAGAAALGAMVWRSRRGKSEAASEAEMVWSPEPAVAATQPLLTPTQAIPIPRQAGNQEEPQTVQLPPVPGN
ncbi:hypothetical protein GCM10009835_25980 [Planosporangium flavigriseum]|uniref:Uncharacterized protein n=1 Tax=Planosporangium flavigriseum TaxID=373681 RepID=A0A8J3PKK3_9ACTN|nr:hypothetical protein Pfl04_06330 [Planosporangium flavigriseum]